MLVHQLTITDEGFSYAQGEHVSPREEIPVTGIRRRPAEDGPDGSRFIHTGYLIAGTNLVIRFNPEGDGWSLFEGYQSKYGYFPGYNGPDA